MNIENFARASRRKLTLPFGGPFGGGKQHKHIAAMPTPSPLSQRELRELVAAMVD